jgi:hypothetical protein
MNTLGRGAESPQNRCAGSLRDSSDALFGSGPLELAEQKRFVHIDDIFRSVNSRHGSLKGAPVHALGLCDVTAGSARGAELSTQGKSAGQSPITRQFAL